MFPLEPQLQEEGNSIWSGSLLQPMQGVAALSTENPLPLEGRHQGHRAVLATCPTDHIPVGGPQELSFLTSASEVLGFGLVGEGGVSLCTAPKL